jgi:hypothetical protein
VRIAVISQQLTAIHNYRDDVVLFRDGQPIAYFMAGDRMIRFVPGLRGTRDGRIFENYLGARALHFRDQSQVEIRRWIREL